MTADSGQSASASETDWDAEVRDFLERGFHLALRFCNDAVLAEDLLQEAMLRIARNRHQFRRQCSVATWMTRVVINVCRDWRRNQNRQLPRQVDWDESQLPVEPQNVLDVQEQQRRIRRLVDRLPDRQREVLVLTVWQQLSAEEVAECLQITKQNVYSNLSVARTQLQKWLASESMDTLPENEK